MSLSLLSVIILSVGCAPKYGCPSMADLKAHKYDGKCAWLKNTESGLVLITDMKGCIFCSYYAK
jgi:hypothetical protein